MKKQQEYEYSKHKACGAINPMDKSLKSWCGQCCRSYHLVHEGITATFRDYERYVTKRGDRNE